MRIAVTSQNRRTVTEHAGRCRKFRIFEVDDGRIVGDTLLELPRDAAFHESGGDQPHPLDGVDVLIAGSMGPGLRRRLARKGIEAVVTREADPQTAARLWLAGELADETPASGTGSCSACG
ncbi:MAG: NifB/NifX family molybdenum-iron cluster-binding protein [Gammaproteobacteria bacterium]